MWGLGCLFWEVFNGVLDQSMSLQNTAKVSAHLAGNAYNMNYENEIDINYNHLCQFWPVWAL